MTETITHSPGTPSWVDIGSPDLEASKAFYTGLFGWEAETAPQPKARGYTLFKCKGKQVVGLRPLQAQARGSRFWPSMHWLRLLRRCRTSWSSALIRSSLATPVRWQPAMAGFEAWACGLPGASEGSASPCCIMPSPSIAGGVCAGSASAWIPRARPARPLSTNAPG